MAAVLATVLLAGTGLYVAVITWLLIGISRSRRATTAAAATPSVCVVVAARDEAETIGGCLEALARQVYAGELQIVVVDDHSADATAQVVRRAQATWGGPTPLALVEAPDPPRFACPKKSALAAGIDIARGDLLMFTDADCAPPENWVQAMAAGFAEDVGLVAGHAYTEPLPDVRHRLLAVDNLGVGALAEGSITMAAPLACTGRSLAYRRVAYEEVGGFADIGHLVSGDDVYFLRLLAARSAWRAAYCATAMVPSAPGATSWGALLQQKLRHASKAARYEGGARWLGLGIYAYHAVLLVGLLQAVLGNAPTLFVGAWLTRWVADLLLLWRFAPRRGRDRVLLAFLPLVEILYIPYVLFLVPLGRVGWFRWKGRRATDLPHPARS